MDCRDWIAEIVEQARRGSPARAGLEDHLSSCPRCAVRWEAEQELQGRLKQIREALPAAGDPAGRDRILARFAGRRRQAALRTRFAWGLAAAAALLAAVVLTRPHPAANPSLAVEQSGEFEETDLEAFESSEFVAVPYAPPLAAGEMVAVLRLDLPPGALVRMGFTLETGYGANVAADVLVGEDYLPRAVRVHEDQAVRE